MYWNFNTTRIIFFDFFTIIILFYLRTHYIDTHNTFESETKNSIDEIKGYYEDNEMTNNDEKERIRRKFRYYFRYYYDQRKS